LALAVFAGAVLVTDRRHMARESVRWSYKSEEFEIGGEAAVWGLGLGDFIGAEEKLRSASLTDLKHAARRYRASMYDHDLTFRVYDVPDDLLREGEEDFSPIPVEFEVSGDHFIITMTTAVEAGVRINALELAQVLSPQLEAHRAVFLEVREEDLPLAKLLTLSVGLQSIRGRTLGDALDLGESLLRLWEASLGGMLTPDSVVDLIVAQRPELLIGQPESDWLEVKGKPYDLKNELEALELAKDVSAFANGPAGGLLVVGFSQKKVEGQDHLKGVVLQPVRAIDPLKHRQALERLILPPPEGLQVEAVETEDGKGILIIRVPPQAAALQPFLVTGAVVEGKVLGSHFALYVRRGEHCEPASPAVIHGQLLAGKVALDSISDSVKDSGAITDSS
jgi:Putative DNA-binding domain